MSGRILGPFGGRGGGTGGRMYLTHYIKIFMLQNAVSSTWEGGRGYTLFLATSPVPGTQ